MEQQEDAGAVESSGLDTFDDGSYTEGPMDDESAGSGVEAASEEQDSEEAPEQTETEEKIDPDSQVNMLENSEDKGEEEEAKADSEKPEGDGEKDQEQEAKSDGEAEVPEDDGATAEEVRNLKAFRDGKAYEIPEDAELKVKVKGKWEKVPLTELRDNYSGKVAYDEKFQEFSSEVKEFKAHQEAYETEIQHIRGHLGKVAELTKAAMNGEANPTESIEYLLDLMGGNPLEYKKAMFTHMAEQLDLYSQLTEGEREAYWVKQENQYLTKRQESLTKRQSEEKAQEELQTKVSGLREAHGISEEDYQTAREDLELGGAAPEAITPENIVQAAKLKPLLLEADRLLEPYRDDMASEEYNSMSIEIATTLLEAPEMPIESIQKLLAEQYEVEEIVSTLVDKTSESKAKEIHKPKKANHLESFDDFDY